MKVKLFHNFYEWNLSLFKDSSLILSPAWYKNLDRNHFTQNFGFVPSLLFRIILNFEPPFVFLSVLVVCKSFLCSHSSEMSWRFVSGQLFSMKTHCLQFCEIFLYLSYFFSTVYSLWRICPPDFLTSWACLILSFFFFLSAILLSSCRSTGVFPQLLLYFHIQENIFNFQELFLDLWVPYI